MRASLSEDVGILGYGHDVPSLRLDISAFADQWALPDRLERLYRLSGRNRVSVGAADEDAVTLAIAAGARALTSLVQPQRVDAVLVGSESHPYAVKSSAVIVADALGLAPDVFAADLEFACRGGSAGLVLSTALARAHIAGAALAIGSDCPQSAPGSLLEASVGAAASALVVGRNDGAIAIIEAIASAASDVTDFWRRDGARFPSVVGRFSVDEGYLAHSERVARALMTAHGVGPEDFRYVVFHQPYASLPARLARTLGFAPAQVKPGLIASRIGNSYSASCLLSLCHLLDTASPGDRILLVSFGSGAGSDGMIIQVTDAIEAFRAAAQPEAWSVADAIGGGHVETIGYGRYAHAQGKLGA